MSTPIEDYGLIGDCQTAALVGRDGSIDWLCWPRFDSDACFAALLGRPSNGCWRFSTEQEARITRCYRPGTLILETTFETGSGRACVTDFMLPRGRTSDLIRIVHGLEGEVQMCMEMVLRFGYGCTMPWVSRLKDGSLRAVAGPDMAVLRTPATLWGENFKTFAMFTMTAGRTLPFVLSYGPSHLPVPEPVDPVIVLQVERHERRGAARRLDGVVDLFQPADRAGDRDHMRAGFGERDRGRVSDAARGTGDERDTAGEGLHAGRQLASASSDNCRGEWSRAVRSVSGVG